MPVRLRHRRRPGVSFVQAAILRFRSVQAYERSVESDSVEGVDAAVQLHEVLVVELPAAMKLISPRPVSALNASVELGLLRGHDPEVDALASHSLPPSIWTAFTLDGMSSRILPRSSRPFLTTAFRSAWEQVHLATGSTAADEPRKQPDSKPGTTSPPSFKERAIRPDHANRATAEGKSGSALYPHLVNTNA